MAKSNFKKIEGKSNKKLNEQYVYINNGSVNKYVAISSLFTIVDSKEVKIATIEEFNMAVKNNQLFEKDRKTKNLKQVVVQDKDFYEKIQEVSIDTSTYGYEESINVNGQYDIPYGIKRAVRIKRNAKDQVVGIISKSLEDGLANKEYLKVKYENGEEDYLSREEIFSQDKKNAFGDKKLKALTKTKVENNFGKKIVEIDLTKAYVFENATITENNIQRPYRETISGFELETFTLSEIGRADFETQIINPSYVEQKYIKIGEDPIVRATNFVALNNNQGDYIKVTFEKDVVDSIVDKKELFLDKKFKVSIDEVGVGESLIGKTLYKKNESGKPQIIATQPITFLQASFTFDKKKYMQETTSKESIYAEGTYLKLQTGKFVKETEAVRPLCYEFAPVGEDCKEYLVKVKDVDGNQSAIIIPDYTIEEMKKKNSFKLGKFEFKKEDIFGLKLSNKKMEDCDVIQTSTIQDDYQSCELLKNPSLNLEMNVITTSNIGLNGEEIDKKEVVTRSKEIFLDLYKSGKYVITSVLDDKGEYKEITGKRYIVSDHVDIPDYSNGYSSYAYVKKDGKYDYNKGVKNAFKKWAKTSWKYGFPVYILGWPFLAVSVPLALTFVGALAATALAVPIVQMLKAREHNKKNGIKADKSKCISKVNKKEILKELKAELKKVSKKGYNFDTDAELRFSERMEDLEHMAFQLGGGKVMSNFSVNDGVRDDVDGTNVHLFKQYEAEMYKEEKELEEMFKGLKEGKCTREEYNAKYDEHQARLYDYVAKDIFVPKDPEYKKVLEAIHATKGFVITKHGKSETMTDKEKNMQSTLSNKSLTIKNDFSISISKLSKEESSVVVKNLQEVAESRPFNYEEHIISSYHKGLKDVKEKEVGEKKAKVEEKKTKTIEKQDKKEKIEDKTEEKKTDKSTKVEKKSATQISDEPKKKVEIDGLGFYITEFKTVDADQISEKELKEKISKHSAATITYEEEVVKMEELTASSLKRIGLAIAYLKANQELSKDKEELLKKYINDNLTSFAKKAKKAQEKNNDEKTQKVVSEIKTLGKDYKKVVTAKKEDQPNLTKQINN